MYNVMHYWADFFDGGNSDTRWSIFETHRSKIRRESFWFLPGGTFRKVSHSLLGCHILVKKFRYQGDILHYWGSLITESLRPPSKNSTKIPIRLYEPIAKQNSIRNGTYNLPAPLVTSTVKSSQFFLLSRLILRQKFSRHDWVAIF